MPLPANDEEWAKEAQRVEAQPELAERLAGVMLIIQTLEKYREDYYSSQRDYAAGVKDGIAHSQRAIWNWYQGRKP